MGVPAKCIASGIRHPSYKESWITRALFTASIVVLLERLLATSTEIGILSSASPYSHFKVAKPILDVSFVVVQCSREQLPTCVQTVDIGWKINNAFAHTAVNLIVQTTLCNKDVPCSYSVFKSVIFS